MDLRVLEEASSLGRGVQGRQEGTSGWQEAHEFALWGAVQEGI